MKMKLLYVALFTSLLCSILVPVQVSAAAYGTVNILDDLVMNNTSSMSVAQINTFLNSFSGTCLGTNSGFATADPLGYSSGAYRYGSNTDAGTAIYHIATHYNLNPQVLIATLEKEQGLIDTTSCHPESQGDAPAFYSWGQHKACSGNGNPYSDCAAVTCGNNTTYSDCSYACKYSGGCVTVALGYSCPGFCKKSFASFSGQISGASWVLRFSEARAYGQLTGYAGYDSGDENIGYSGPMTAGYRQRVAGGSSVYYDGSYTDSDGNTMRIANGATASMLSYTPFYARSYTNDKLFHTSFVNWFGSTYAYVYNGVSFKDVFDPTYYAANNPDVASAVGSDSLALFNHFKQYGMSEGRQASATFNVNSYLKRYPDLRNIFHWNLPAYYTHYEQWGIAQGRIATGDYLGGTTTLNGTDYSAVYNFDYYEKNNPDIANYFGLDDAGALQHFIKYGMTEGRQANTDFNVTDYRNRYADLRWSSGFGWNLPAYYMHYIQHGKAEGRIANVSGPVQYLTSFNGVDYTAVYDFATYQSNNPDLKTVFGNNDLATIQHFVQYGMSEGRQASASFNVSNYMNRYPDLKAVFGNNFKLYYMHYIQYGKAEGRIGS